MRFRRSLAALTAAPLLALVACSTGSTEIAGDASDADGFVNDPPDKTSDGRGGGEDGRGDGDKGRAGNDDQGDDKNGGESAPPLTADTFLLAMGKAQLRAETAHMSATISATGQTTLMEGDIKMGYDFADHEMDMTMSSGGLSAESVQIILVDSTMYVNLGAASQSKFAKIDFNDSSNPLAQQLSKAVESADPLASLKALRNGLTSFQRVGTANIDGLATTQYRMDIDTDTFLTAQGLGDVPQQLAGKLPKTIRYDLWIDNDNLLRQMTAAMGDLVQVTLEMTDWGKPVKITAPPPGQITKTDPFASLSTG